MSARYMNFSPSATHSPQLAGMRSSSVALADHEKYLTELLAERQKLGPFVQVLPMCYRLLGQGDALYPLDWDSIRLWYTFLFLKMDCETEIARVTTLLGNSSFLDHNGPEHGSPLTHGGLHTNGGVDMSGWAAYQSERMSMLQPSPHAWHGATGGGSAGLVVKKTMRVDVPADKYPNFNFVGRLLGPRGNSLKRVEQNTDCRVLIRGRGSIKDPTREEMMRDKPGYEHLNEPLHILVEAELPAHIIDSRLIQAREILEELLKPVDESQDYFKKQQLRELAILNGTLREDGSSMAGSVSPFNSNNMAMKRAKTRG